VVVIYFRVTLEGNTFVRFFLPEFYKVLGSRIILMLLWLRETFLLWLRMLQHRFLSYFIDTVVNQLFKSEHKGKGTDISSDFL
jgi:hypothetical protein